MHDDYLYNLLLLKKENIGKDLRLNEYKFLNFDNNYNDRAIISTYDSFYYNHSRFLGNYNLTPFPKGSVPKFIKTKDIILPLAFYQRFLTEDMWGLLCVQFLAAFNIFLGGDPILSKNATSELFHNLSWQALSNDYDKVKIQFSLIAILVKNIDYMLEKKLMKIN